MKQPRLCLIIDLLYPQKINNSVKGESIDDLMRHTYLRDDTYKESFETMQSAPPNDPSYISSNNENKQLNRQVNNETNEPLPVLGQIKNMNYATLLKDGVELKAKEDTMKLEIETFQNNNEFDGVDNEGQLESFEVNVSELNKSKYDKMCVYTATGGLNC